MVLDRIGVHQEQFLTQEGLVAVGQVDAGQLLLQVGQEGLLLLRAVLVGKACVARQQVGGYVVAWLEAVVGMDAAVYQGGHPCKYLPLR